MNLKIQNIETLWQSISAIFQNHLPEEAILERVSLHRDIVWVTADISISVDMIRNNLDSCPDLNQAIPIEILIYKIIIMRPKKNRHFCPDYMGFKMCFETEKKAYAFIEHESAIILEENGYCPIRAYYCPVCGTWHLTSELLSNEDCEECCVEKEEMERCRRLLCLVIRNNNTISLNLSRKIRALSQLLKRKIVDWTVSLGLIIEIMEIFEKVNHTPYRYIHHVRRLREKFIDLWHLYTWRRKLIPVA